MDAKLYRERISKGRKRKRLFHSHWLRSWRLCSVIGWNHVYHHVADTRPLLRWKNSSVGILGVFWVLIFSLWHQRFNQSELSLKRSWPMRSRSCINCQPAESDTTRSVWEDPGWVQGGSEFYGERAGDWRRSGSFVNSVLHSMSVCSTLIGRGSLRLGSHWSRASDCCWRQHSHAIKNQRQKPPTRGF